MSARRQIPKHIQTLVRQRANCLCEYRHASEQWKYVEFTIVTKIETKSATVCFGYKLEHPQNQGAFTLFITRSLGFRLPFFIENILILVIVHVKNLFKMTKRILIH
ncbi:hypothetical protein SD81_003315 [Tolypothrix campylonemoides VB511288]|nr:hypothetical protein SD81_003315 [Tolypothrix campylonemoides VB511288]